VPLGEYPDNQTELTDGFQNVPVLAVISVLVLLWPVAVGALWVLGGCWVGVGFVSTSRSYVLVGSVQA